MKERLRGRKKGMRSHEEREEEGGAWGSKERILRIYFEDDEEREMMKMRLMTPCKSGEISPKTTCEWGRAAGEDVSREEKRERRRGMELRLRRKGSEGRMKEPIKGRPHPPWQPNQVPLVSLFSRHLEASEEEIFPMRWSGARKKWLGGGVILLQPREW